MPLQIKKVWFMLAAASFILTGCGSNKPSKEESRSMPGQNLAENFLDEEKYFTAKTEMNSTREQVAVRRAEAEAIQSLGTEINLFVNEILRFQEQLDPNEPVQFPGFTVLKSREFFKKYIEFPEPEITIQPDSSYNVVLFARFPKNKLPEFIMEKNFEQGESLEKFQENDGIEWLKERVVEEPNVQ